MVGDRRQEKGGLNYLAREAGYLAQHSCIQQPFHNSYMVARSNGSFSV